MDEIIIAIGLIIFLLVVSIVIYKSWEERRKGRDFYLDSIIAYKVGLIEKKAKDNDINLIYPQQKDDFIDKLENDLEGDLNRIN